MTYLLLLLALFNRTAYGGNRIDGLIRRVAEGVNER
jgi:hypothetical protein